MDRIRSTETQRVNDEQKVDYQPTVQGYENTWGFKPELVIHDPITVIVIDIIIQNKRNHSVSVPKSNVLWRFQRK